MVNDFCLLSLFIQILMGGLRAKWNFSLVIILNFKVWSNCNRQGVFIYKYLYFSVRVFVYRLMNR